MREFKTKSRLVVQKADTCMKLFIRMLITVGVLLLFHTADVKASGWLDCLNYSKDITLGQSVGDKFTGDDYYDETKKHNTYNDFEDYRWKVYKFTLPQDGKLEIKVESSNGNCFHVTSGNINDFVEMYKGDNLISDYPHYNMSIMSANNPAQILRGGMIGGTYNSAYGIYSGSSTCSLSAGTYYLIYRVSESIVKKDYLGNGKYQYTYYSRILSDGYKEDLSYSITLNFTQPVTSVSLNKSEIKLQKGDTATLTATLQPASAIDQSITWSSSDTTIATVSKGVVSAVNPGVARITVTSSNGISASCSVTVIKAKSDSGEDQLSKAKLVAGVTDVTVGKHQMTIHLKKDKKITGYQISYKLKGKKWKKKSSKKAKLIIKKLKSNKTYLIRVRSYIKVKGKTYYGKWSKTMKVKTKK